MLGPAERFANTISNKPNFFISDAGFRVCEHPPGPSRSSRCSQNRFLTGRIGLCRNPETQACGQFFTVIRKLLKRPVYFHYTPREQFRQLTKGLFFPSEFGAGFRKAGEKRFRLRSSGAWVRVCCAIMEAAKRGDGFLLR